MTKMLRKMISKRMFLSGFVLGICALSCGTLGAAGANFLKLGVGARALGLGSAYTAIAEDVTSLYWNPAGLASLSKKELGAMHAEMFADTRYDFIGYAHPTSKLNFGVSAVYLSQGNIDGRTAGRAKSDDFTADDLAVTFGGSRLFAERMGIGVSFKLIQSRIAAFSSRSYAFDVGYTLRPGFSQKWNAVRMGLAVQNIGPRAAYINESYDLPLTVAAGLGVEPVRSVLVSADIKRQVHDAQTQFSAGAEFTPVSFFALRAGFATDQSANRNILEKRDPGGRLSNLAGLGLGMGFKVGMGSIDYSFTPAGEIGNIQRISLGLKF